jgi:hypothetical protein
MRGVATLQELETSWSHDDVMRALAMLQMKDDIEAQRAEDARNA